MAYIKSVQLALSRTVDATGFNVLLDIYDNDWTNSLNYADGTLLETITVPVETLTVSSNSHTFITFTTAYGGDFSGAKTTFRGVLRLSSYGTGSVFLYRLNDWEASVSWRRRNNVGTWSSAPADYGIIITKDDDSILIQHDDVSTLADGPETAYPLYGFSTAIPTDNAPDKADTPFPADDADGVAPGYAITLTWEDPGEGESNAATSWDVYFGTEFTGPVFQETVTEKEWAIPINFTGLVDYLSSGATYQWRIDAKNESGTTTGDQWEFETSLVVGLGKARDPVPAHEATDQSVNLASVSFGDGEGASTYDVYFGTPGNLTLIGNVTYASKSKSLAYQSMLANTTYNWRVDSKNSLGTVTGDVWEFTTTSDFDPPDPSSGGLGPNGENTAFITIRKLTAAANDKFWYEDI